MAAIDRSKLTPGLRKYDLAGETFARVVKANPADKIDVEIGDAKQPDFKPQFKVARWANECNFSLRAQEDPGAVVDVVGEKVVYRRADGVEVHQYEVPAGEDGGFEFEWVLPSKPASNVLSGTIRTKGLAFHYQGPLPDRLLKRGATRPDNVVGSYAVYHATKRDNAAGGNEYRTGKFCHIYRPKAVDANGVETWCELAIDVEGELLTVTVPEKFLEEAVYPVTVDPTFGYTSAGATNFGWGNDQVDSHKANPGTSGTCESMSWYASGTGNAKGIIVKASDETIITDGVTAPVAMGSLGWHTANFGTDPSVTAQDYYLGFVWAGSGSIYGDLVGGTASEAYDPSNSYTTPTNPTDFEYYDDWSLSIYATYTAAAGGAIAGTTAMTFGAGSSTLTGSGALAGTCSMSFGAGSSAMAGAGALAGSAALAFTPTGTMTSPGAMAGVAAMIFNDPHVLEVDQWLHFEASSDGTEITDTILLSSVTGEDLGGDWITVSDPAAQTPGAIPNATIETDASMPLPGRIAVDGAAAVRDTGTRGARFTMGQNGAIQLSITDPGHQLAVGYMMRWNGPSTNWGPRDVVGLRSDPSGNYQFLQFTDNASGDEIPQGHVHWQPGGSGIGPAIFFTRGQWYWVAQKHVAGGESTEVRIYDAATGSLIGISTGAVSTGTQGCTTIQLGMVTYGDAAHAAQSIDFDNFVTHKDNANHPLLPNWSAQESTLTGAGALAGVASVTFGAGSSAMTGAAPIAGVAALTFSPTGTLLAPGAMAATCSIAFGAGSSAMGGAGALAGASALSFGEGSTILTGAGALAGASALTFAPTGTMLAPGDIAGTCAITFGAGSSAMAGAGAMAGVSSLAFGAGSSALSGGGALAGACAIAFTNSATLLGGNQLAGVVALSFTDAAALSGSGSLAGACAIEFGGSGTLELPSGALAGSAAITISATGSTLGAGALAGHCSLELYATGTLDQPPAVLGRRGGSHHSSEHAQRPRSVASVRPSPNPSKRRPNPRN